jgi:hypothetical protein
MPRTINTLADVAVGTTLLLPCRMTAKSADGATFDVLTRQPGSDDWQVSGAFSIAMPGGAVTGAWTTDPREQPVQVIAFALTVGDVVRKDETGEILVVAAVGLGPDRNLWSPSATGHRTFTGDGWVVIDHIEL